MLVLPQRQESLGAVLEAEQGICKISNRLTDVLFLCLFNACKHNKACRELYERIVNKGKSKKLALITEANKLLKQYFTIAKPGRPYDESYVSVLLK